MKFNKYHGMLCAICRFVHKYEMAGRISEESNEAFNATLAEIKKRLRCMPTILTRIEVMNARTQSNLNGDILEHKIQLKLATTATQRGPQKAKAKVADNLSITKRVDEFIFLRVKNI